MREIKFRAWDKEIKAMRSWNELRYITYNLKWIQDNEGMNEINDMWVDPDFELMQHTGLNDRHGVEIYEGDIVKLSGSGYEDKKIGRIVWGGHWEQAGFGIETNFPLPPNDAPVTWDLLTPQWQKHLEVIGNLYENPELLEKKE